jgi:hypothetical protein
MAAITTMAIGAVTSGYQMYKGIQDKKDAEAAAERYERQEFNNVADDMQVSTLGSDLQREEQARLSATQVGALQGAGSRGVIGGLGRVEAAGQAVSQGIAANLDAQQKEIDRMRAQDDANIRAMQEQRENQDLAALSSQYNAGNQMMWQGISGVAQSAMAGVNQIQKERKPVGPGNGGATPTDKASSSNGTTSNYDYLKNMSDIVKGLSTPQQPQNPATTNNYGYVPQNIGGFMQNQFYNPNQIKYTR